MYLAADASAIGLLVEDPANIQGPQLLRKGVCDGSHWGACALSWCTCYRPLCTTVAMEQHFPADVQQ